MIEIINNEKVLNEMLNQATNLQHALHEIKGLSDVGAQKMWQAVVSQCIQNLENLSEGAGAGLLSQ